MLYVCFVLNHTYNVVTNNIPMNIATGSSYDISPLIRFRFWQPVFYMYNDSDFSTDSTEERERFVGIYESIRHQMIFKIISDKSSKIIHLSNIRPANISLNMNICLNLLIIPTVVKSKRYLSDDAIVSTIHSTIANDNSLNSSTSVPILEISNLAERAFLIPADENGQYL